MTPDQELAWVAGLFEGEGCFYTSHDNPKRSNGGTYNIVASVAMTDQDTVEAFHAIVKVGTVRVSHTPWRKSKGYQPQYVWSCTGRKAKDFGFSILPFLFSRRREQFAKCLAKCGPAIEQE